MMEINKIYLSEGVKVKKCNKCATVLPVTAYNQSLIKKSGVRGECKSCQHKTRANYTSPTAEQDRRKALLKNYSLTIEEYDNLLAKQSYSCAICLRSCRQFKRRLHVDHCHKTNKVRGLLCPPCNMGLGRFSDDPLRLRLAANYVEEAK